MKGLVILVVVGLVGFLGYNYLTGESGGGLTNPDNPEQSEGALGGIKEFFANIEWSEIFTFDNFVWLCVIIAGFSIMSYFYKNRRS